MNCKSSILLPLFVSLIAGCARHHEIAKVEYINPYQQPLNSPGGKFAGLPPAVQNTIRSEAGAAEILDIVKDTSSGQPVYEVYFVNRLLPPLFVARDGSVLNPDLTVAVGAGDDSIGVLRGSAITGLKPSDLPQDVMKVVQKRAPNSEIGFISREMWGEQEVYVVSFKEPTHTPTLYIATDGTVLTPRPQK